MFIVSHLAYILSFIFSIMADKLANNSKLSIHIVIIVFQS